MKRGFSIVEIILAMAVLLIIAQTATVTVLNGFGANTKDETNLKNNILNKNTLEQYISTRNIGLTLSGVENIQKFTSGIGNTLFVYLTNWRKPVAKRGNWATASILGSINLSGGADGGKTIIWDSYYFGTRLNAKPDFNVFNISNGTTINTVSNYSGAGKTFGIALDGNYAYLATSDNAAEFRIVDITNISAPVSAGTINISPKAAGIDVVSDKSNRGLILTANLLYSINTTNKITPTSYGNVAIVGTGRQLCVNGNYLYVSTSSTTREIQIFDLGTSTPSNVGQFDLPGGNDALSINCLGNYLATGLSDGTLIMLNATNPTNLSVGSSLAVGGSINAIDHSDDNTLLFLATSNSTMEFQVIDISNHLTPSRIGSVNLAGDALGISYNIAEDTVIIGNSDNSNEFYFIKSGP